jgi:ArsR family transcriptional regulator, lead/cadmium/zinc/bismuth-responsive transcriptional repressor
MDLCNARIIHHDRVDRARENSLPPGEISSLAALFKALGDVTRQRIIWALVSEEMCVCDLAALLGITESGVSHQLRLLRTMKLVANRREGPVLYYRLADDHIGMLLEIALEHARE